MSTTTSKELLYEQRRERARNRQGIAELIDQVRALKQSVGHAQYVRGVITKGVRWEIEESLDALEQRLWTEWKTPSERQEA